MSIFFLGFLSVLKFINTGESYIRFSGLKNTFNFKKNCNQINFAKLQVSQSKAKILPLFTVVLSPTSFEFDEQYNNETYGNWKSKAAPT